MELASKSRIHSGVPFRGQKSPTPGHQEYHDVHGYCKAMGFEPYIAVSGSFWMFLDVSGCFLAFLVFGHLGYLQVSFTSVHFCSHAVQTHTRMQLTFQSMLLTPRLCCRALFTFLSNVTPISCQVHPISTPVSRGFPHFVPMYSKRSHSAQSDCPPVCWVSIVNKDTLITDQYHQ